MQSNAVEKPKDRGPRPSAPYKNLMRERKMSEAMKAALKNQKQKAQSEKPQPVAQPIQKPQVQPEKPQPVAQPIQEPPKEEIKSPVLPVVPEVTQQNADNLTQTDKVQTSPVDEQSIESPIKVVESPNKEETLPTVPVVEPVLEVQPVEKKAEEKKPIQEPAVVVEQKKQVEERVIAPVSRPIGDSKAFGMSGRVLCQLFNVNNVEDSFVKLFSNDEITAELPGPRIFQWSRLSNGPLSSVLMSLKSSEVEMLLLSHRILNEFVKVFEELSVPQVEPLPVVAFPKPAVAKSVPVIPSPRPVVVESKPVEKIVVAKPQEVEELSEESEFAAEEEEEEPIPVPMPKPIEHPKVAKSVAYKQVDASIAVGQSKKAYQQSKHVLQQQKFSAQQYNQQPSSGGFASARGNYQQGPQSGNYYQERQSMQNMEVPSQQQNSGLMSGQHVQQTQYPQQSIGGSQRGAQHQPISVHQQHLGGIGRQSMSQQPLPYAQPTVPSYTPGYAPTYGISQPELYYNQSFHQN